MPIVLLIAAIVALMVLLPDPSDGVSEGHVALAILVGCAGVAGLVFLVLGLVSVLSPFC